MAKSIMVQGTTSNAGKSFLAAALCRIFKQDGHSVAPFKSQNMALNSFITADGLEMGRAQVMQAEAAGIAPTVEMNPILLKPTNDTGSQVIVNGEVRGVMSARDYFAFKKNLVPDVMKAYNALADSHDIIVLEGAGSPAEINLKQEDIVNMGMARMAGAPVLLCADTDKGGVFASLYGTVALLEPEERARVKGLIINNFRGDKTILDPGVEMLEQLTGIPVVGVVPHLQVDLDDEDSLTERFDRSGGKGLALGKYAETEALECAWPAVFYGDVAVSGSLKVNGAAVEERLFPVGSAYLTATAAAPELPGTWQQVQAGLSGVYVWRRTT